MLRVGNIQTIRSEDLVTGYIIRLEVGDAVPADARILESVSLKAEESALTGEPCAPRAAGAEDFLPSLYMIQLFYRLFPLFFFLQRM